MQSANGLDENPGDRGGGEAVSLGGIEARRGVHAIVQRDERGRPPAVRAWVLAARPATLLLGAVPVLVGTAVAHRVGGMHIASAIAALLGALLVQIGTNLANDVFDHEKGADTAERVGPKRATQSGWLSARAVRRAMMLTFAMAGLAGLYLTSRGGWPVVAIGLASVVSGIAYTGGPFPLGYRGLGDVFVFAFFGLVAVATTEFVQTGAFSTTGVLAGVSVGALATAVLVVNNVRDRRTDALAAKRTLVVRFGDSFGRAQYALLVATAFALPPLMAAMRLAPRSVVFTLLLAPLGMQSVLRFLRARDPAVLNAMLGATARLSAMHGALFAAMLVAGG